MKKLSKILVLVLALAMMLTIASMFTVSAAGTVRVYCQDDAGWGTVYCYYWGGTGNTWPGTKMQYDEDLELYYCDVPADNNMVIFNNGSGKQTADLNMPTDDNVVYNNAAISWGVIGGEFEAAEPTVVYVKNTAGWSTVNCYYWGGNGNSWPGEKMELVDAEKKLWKFEIPAGTQNCIFNNGTAQSADLTVPKEGSDLVVYNNSAAKWEALELPEPPHVCNFVAGEVVAPTYTAGGYTVYTCSCGLTENRDQTPALEVTFPEAVVTPIPGIVDETTTLTFALNFGIKGVSIVDGEIVLDESIITEEYIAAVLETYGKMYVDYRLTISGLSDPSVTLNSDGTADGFLGGQYDTWSENWVCVPFGDSVVIENGKSLMIMEYAAELMGKPGLRMILEEIVTAVIDFDCGVYFTPEFLEHNPDMVVTLELIVFNENEDGELVDVITVAENVFTVPHEHDFVEGECECGELDPAYVNTLVVGDTNKIIVNGDTFNDYNLPVEWVWFIADEKAHYEFVGNNGALVFIFDLDGNLLCMGTGKADLEAGTYAICVGNGLTGVLNVAVTKSEIVVPEHENKLVVGETNKIVVDGSVLNQNNNPIAWVPFVVEEKAHYAMTSEDPTALVYIFDASYNLVCGGTGAAVLEAGTYLVCVGNAQIGDIYVTVTKTEISAECEHEYYYMNCKLCGAANPYFENNFMVEGTNKVICNEYHLVDTTGHGFPYQFTTYTVTEAGHYVFTVDKMVGLTLFTTELNAEGADWTAGTGASWGEYITGFEIDLQPGTYYIGIIFIDGEGEYEFNLEKVEDTQPVDPQPEDKEDAEEPNFFAKIWAKILAFLASIVDFFKGIFA